MLFRAMPSCILVLSTDGDSATSLGNLLEQSTIQQFFKKKNKQNKQTKKTPTTPTDTNKKNPSK